MPPPVVPPTAEQKRGMQETVLDMMIDDLLMRQFLRKHAPAPTPAAIDKELADLKAVLEKQKRTFQDFLKESNQTEAQLRTDIAARLQWKTYLAGRVNDAMVKTYYDTNKVFFDKVMVQANYILIKLRPGASEVEKQAARTKLLTIKQEIAAGKIDFAEAVKKYSECPLVKQNSGDTGYFAYKFMAPEPIAKAAFAMKVGEVSDVVPTDHGLYLIKVTGRKDGEPSRFDAIKDEVRDIYGQEIYQQVVEEQRKAAQIQVSLP
jgi:parvulin-like peptidyl-prolyl isomerase